MLGFPGPTADGVSCTDSGIVAESSTGGARYPKSTATRGSKGFGTALRGTRGHREPTGAADTPGPLAAVHTSCRNLDPTHPQEVIVNIRIGSKAPDFEAESTQGHISFHHWLGNSWCVLFSHPKDFTPVCTTELGYMAFLKPEFDRRNCKIAGLSVDSVEDHQRWLEDIRIVTGAELDYPLIADPDLRIAKLYEMLPENAGNTASGRTPSDNQTVRTVFVVAPDRTIRAMLSYPMTSGRNFDEVLRLLDSIQLTAAHRLATPVNWKRGEDVIIAGSVSDDEARKIYPQGWKAPRPYVRIVSPPT